MKAAIEIAIGARLLLCVVVIAALANGSQARADVVPVPPDELDLTSPDGGETWVPGSSHTITWKAPSDTVGVATIELYKGEQLATTIGEADIASETFQWTLPASLTAGEDYRVCVWIGHLKECSASTFTIGDSAREEDGGGCQAGKGTLTASGVLLAAACLVVVLLLARRRSTSI
jgi:hypothetical protein